MTNKLLLLARAEAATPASAREHVDLKALIAGVRGEPIALALYVVLMPRRPAGHTEE